MIICGFAEQAKRFLQKRFPHAVPAVPFRCSIRSAQVTEKSEHSQTPRSVFNTRLAILEGFWRLSQQERGALRDEVLLEKLPSSGRGGEGRGEV
jgi:hypothetical protein